MESQLFTSQTIPGTACLNPAGQSQYITHKINAAKKKEGGGGANYGVWSACPSTSKKISGGKMEALITYRNGNKATMQI